MNIPIRMFAQQRLNSYFCVLAYKKHKIMWRNIFEGISSFFENVAFAPLNALYDLELKTWWGANIVTWIFLAILVVLLVYWVNQLKIFDDNQEEDKSSKAHSFLE